MTDYAHRKICQHHSALNWSFFDAWLCRTVLVRATETRTAFPHSLTSQVLQKLQVLVHQANQGGGGRERESIIFWSGRRILSGWRCWAVTMWTKLIASHTPLVTHHLRNTIRMLQFCQSPPNLYWSWHELADLEEPGHRPPNQSYSCNGPFPLSYHTPVTEPITYHNRFPDVFDLPRSCNRPTDQFRPWLEPVVTYHRHVTNRCTCHSRNIHDMVILTVHDTHQAM